VFRVRIRVKNLRFMMSLQSWVRARVWVRVRVRPESKALAVSPIVAPLLLTLPRVRIQG